mgnify:CR=1 FL=1
MRLRFDDWRRGADFSWTDLMATALPVVFSGAAAPRDPSQMAEHVRRLSVLGRNNKGASSMRADFTKTLRKQDSSSPRNFSEYWSNHQLNADAAAALGLDSLQRLLPYGRTRLTPPSLWAGPSGIGATAHKDNADNFMFQLSGTKEWLLLPPYVADDFGLYDSRTPRFSNMRWQPKDVPQHTGKANGARAQWFVEPPRLGWLARLPHRMRFVTRPGDLLYLPTGWSHVTMIRELSVSVNWWKCSVFSESGRQAMHVKDFDTCHPNGRSVPAMQLCPRGACRRWEPAHVDARSWPEQSPLATAPHSLASKAAASPKELPSWVSAASGAFKREWKSASQGEWAEKPPPKRNITATAASEKARGTAAFKAGNFVEAAAAFAAAIKLDDAPALGVHMLHNNRASALAALGQHMDALHAAEEALRTGGAFFSNR